MLKKHFLLPCLFFLVSCSFQMTYAQTNWQAKVAPELIGQSFPGEAIEFMVQMTEQADLSPTKNIHGKTEKGNFVFQTLTAVASRSQQGLVQWLEAEGVLYQSFWVSNCLWVRATPEVMESIALRPEVARLNQNATFKVTEPVEKRYSPQNGNSRADRVTWGIEKIRADQVWAMGFTGKDVVIGGQDTGYEWEHPAIKSTYRGWDGSNADHNYQWHDAIHQYDPMLPDTINPCGLDSPVPCDDNYHGTHTMGTMASIDTSYQIGVAPGAKWIGCRNMERGYGTPQTYLECFQWFLAPTDLSNANPDPALAPHVINNSWSCPELEGCDSSNFATMEAAVNSLRAAGVMVVVSAGNDGDDCSTIANPPAIFSGSFSIGASRSQDTIARFSSRGPVMIDGSGRIKPDVVAPGVNVRSSIGQDSFAYWGGTSMAAPHVAGMVALMISADPSLAGEVDKIESIIKQTAVQLITQQACGNVAPTSTPNNTYGHGRVDALAAVQEVLRQATAIEDLQLSTGQLFPNPFHDQLIFNPQELKGDFSLGLYSLTGQRVYSDRWTGAGGSEKSFELSDLPAGVYLYLMKNQGSFYRGKVVKY